MKNKTLERPAQDEGRRRRPSSFGLDGTDTILAIIILAICGYLYYLTTRFESASEQMSQNIPPEWFPQILLIFIMGLTIVIPFERKFKGKKELAKERQTKVKPISIITAAMLCLIIFFMPWLGTLATMVFVCFLLPLLWGERRLHLIALFAIVFPGVVTILFTKLLGVYFESGIWANLF